MRRARARRGSRCHSDRSEQLEQEPNDTPDTSTPVKLPGAIEGRFETRGDRDYYQFEAKKGERFVFTGQTRTLGSPSDLFMRLYNAEGGVLAEAEDTGAEEGILNVTFPADGLYRLRVEDTNHRGGADEVYRIAIEPYQPGFSLAAAVENVNAPQNGVFVVKVTTTRRDYNGPITLSLEGAGEGCTLQHNIIPEGKPETTMSVTLGPSLAAGKIAMIHVVGQAKIGATEFRTTASTLLAMRTSLSGLPFPPAVLDGTLGLGVGPVFPPFFQLAAALRVVPLWRSSPSTWQLQSASEAVQWFRRQGERVGRRLAGRRDSDRRRDRQGQNRSRTGVDQPAGDSAGQARHPGDRLGYVPESAAARRAG